MTAYADPTVTFKRITANVFATKPVTTVDHWCDKHRRLPKAGAGAATPGRWNTDTVAYLRGPMRAFTDPLVEEIAVQKSTQVGASELLICCALYTIDCCPQTQMFVYPTATKGKKFNTGRLVPSIRACPPIGRLLRSPRDLTADQLRLDGTLINFGYTGSSDAMRSDPIGIIHLDEIDAFDCSGEDPIENARSRQETFEERKLIKVSTPMGDSAGITKEYEEADVRNEYHCPCPQCGQYFEPFDFGLLGWIGGVNTDPLIAASNCWIQCPNEQCGSKIREENKRWMVQHGIWKTQGEWIDSDGSITSTLDPITKRITDPELMASRYGSDFFREEYDAFGSTEYAMLGADTIARVQSTLGVRILGTKATGPRVGYRINRFCSLISEKGWSGIVEDFVRADGRPDPTWWRDRMGRSPSTKGERIETADLLQLCIGEEYGGHHFGRCPSWAIALFGGIDVQKKCIKVYIKAYGVRGHRQAVVYTKRIKRDETLKLVDVIRTIGEIGRFPVANSTRTLTPFFLIDSGYWTLQVYALVDSLQEQYGKRFLACKGNDGRWNDPLPYRRATLTEYRGPDGRKYALPKPVELVHVNTAHFKDEAAARMRPLDENIVAQMIASATEGLAGETKQNAIEELTDRIQPIQMPGIESWRDADAVVRELTNAEKVLLGRGSGRSGNDGRGLPRQAWRKKHEHQPDDYLDGEVYASAAAQMHLISEWTAERLEQVSQISSTGNTSPARITSSAHF